MTLAANTRRLAGVFVSVLFLAACATPPQTRELLTDTAIGLPYAFELSETPFYPQQQYQCGPAALATVLGAHAVTVTPDELVDAVYVPALQGSLPEEITATARRYQMLAYRLPASLEALFIEITHGNPVLVMQNLGTRWFQNWHFAVVIGFDLAGQEVILRSGTTRRQTTTLATFERTWARSDYWALVILPAGKVPASARLAPYLQATHDLEASGQPAAALAAYQAATQHWPDEPRTWMTYGNSLYAADEIEAAASAFRQVTWLSPDNPRGWNNLAYALLQTGCPQQAQRAAGCAVRYGGDEANYRDTLAEIRGLAQGTDSPPCVPVECQK
ncbi:MAG: PA2778 family cysteine peptidase [Gammaproteobacteria bacterium]|nr:PA2778 family cysteine peptidase [Gammaproteobacteria bacterium]